MSDVELKVGIISCSGEEIPEGTISRLATRRVLELLRPGSTVTICLPLFLAGNEAEQGFARNHPTITVDGCDKLCAKNGTERYSGPVSAALVVSDILEDCSRCARSTRHRTDADKEAVWLVSERIAAEVDSILEKGAAAASPGSPGSSVGCSCSSPVQGIELQVDGRQVNVAGLPLIFSHLAENGLSADGSSGNTLLETVRIYHQIEPEEEQDYRAALVDAYREFRRNRT